MSTWKTFEELQASGKARSIGVSNFKPSHLDQLFRETDIVPAVNQIQVSPPSIPRPAARAFNEANGIITESYSPLGAGSDLLNAPVLAGIGNKYGKTPGQVVLRWHIQQGLVAIPKTANPQRMKENLDIFDFELDHDDLTKLQTLDAGPDAGVDSDVQGALSMGGTKKALICWFVHSRQERQRRGHRRNFGR